jgi:PHD/YefM family antitoxin component YafN of YafNO toxin-antitoxin module
MGTMLNLSKGIDSLSNFKRHTVRFLEQLQETGEPVVLTINGKAELVVQDAKSYQRLLELAEQIETVESIRQGMQEFDEGKGISLDEFREPTGAIASTPSGFRLRVRPYTRGQSCGRVPGSSIHNGRSHAGGPRR